MDVKFNSYPGKVVKSNQFQVCFIQNKSYTCNVHVHDETNNGFLGAIHLDTIHDMIECKL